MKNKFGCSTYVMSSLALRSTFSMTSQQLCQLWFFLKIILFIGIFVKTQGRRTEGRTVTKREQQNTSSRAKRKKGKKKKTKSRIKSIKWSIKSRKTLTPEKQQPVNHFTQTPDSGIKISTFQKEIYKETNKAVTSFHRQFYYKIFTTLVY